MKEGGRIRLFRFKSYVEGEENYINSLYKKKRESWINFIRIMLGVFCDSLELNQKKRIGESKEIAEAMRDEEKSFHDWASTYLSKNASAIGNTIAKYTDPSRENPITFDDIREMIELFVQEQEVGGGKSNQLSNLLKQLMKFDIEKGDAEQSEKYSLYARKVGLIFHWFVDYYLASNIDTYFKLKNKTLYIHEEDEEDTSIPYTITPSKVGAEEKSIEDVVEEPFYNVTRDLYKMFFEGVDLNKAKMTISELYNIYLVADSNSFKHHPYQELMMESGAIKLTLDDKKSLKDLISEDFLDNWGSGKNVNYSLLYETLKDDLSEKNRVLATFFALLVKCGIRLEPRCCSYFNDLSVFKVAIVEDVESFRKVMESTKIDSQEYSEFPLLKDKDIKTIKKRFADTFKKKGFINSLDTKSPDDESTDIQLVIPATLKIFLEKVINISQRFSGYYKTEIVEGLNEETITPRDIIIAKQILYGEKKETFNEKFKKYSKIYSLLVWDPTKTMNIREDLPDLNMKAFIKVLNSSIYRFKQEINNRQRLDNLWELIKASYFEIRYILDTLNKPIPSIKTEEKVVYGVETWYLGNYKIPKVFVGVSKEFYIEILGVIVTIENELLTRGFFQLEGQLYSVNKGKVSPYLNSPDINIENIERDIEIASNVDPKITPASLASWLLEDSTVQKSISKREESKIAMDSDFSLNLNDIIDIDIDLDL